MRFGVCYYPEQWPETRWPTDAEMMRALGIDVVRIGEFAWSKMEPAEGRFEWDWLDRAIDTLAAAGHAVVLGTPTAAPPAWIASRYPDTLPVDEHGRRRSFGGRRHYCANSPVYHELTDRIVTAMAERYGSAEAVTGWQIDNEFGGSRTARCYCRNCVEAFRRWLAERYGSLKALNEAWGTPFWSQTYGSWDQIGAPVGTVAAANPSQVLDFQRFSSATWVNYQKRQIDILRAHAESSRGFITHNTMGLFFTEIDYFRLSADLDFVALDNYPTGGIDRVRDLLYLDETPSTVHAPDAGDPALTGFELDLARGLKDRPFWIMEQQPGHINWSRYNMGVRPEVVRLWCWQAAAQGAETIVFFRWRASVMAQEQYHDGVLGHDAAPSTGHAALSRLKEDRQRLEDFTAAPLSPDVALIFDYESLWAVQIQPQRSGLEYLNHLFRFYRALQGMGLPTAVVAPTADLSQYSLVIAPMLHIGREQIAQNLSSFAQDGGTVLLSIRSGFKTLSNRVTEMALPGAYREMTGVRIQNWSALSPGVQYSIQSQVAGLNGEAAVWADSLAPEKAVSIAHYQTGPFAGQSALTENRLGAGKVIYLGWHPSVTQSTALIASLYPKADANPSGANREAGLVILNRGTKTLVLNYSEHHQEATLPGGQKVAIPPLDLLVVDRA